MSSIKLMLCIDPGKVSSQTFRITEINMDLGRDS